MHVEYEAACSTLRLSNEIFCAHVALWCSFEVVARACEIKHGEATLEC
jgi:hypothetical protein